MRPSKPTVVLLIAFGGFVVVALPAGALGIAWRAIQETFGLGLDALGMVFTVVAVGRLPVSFYSGAIIHRLGVSRMLLLGCLLGAGGTLAQAAAPAWGVFIAAVAVGSLGSSALINGLNTFVAANYRSSRMNWLHASFGLGSMLGTFLVTSVMITLGLSWRWAYTLLAGGLVLILLAVLLTRRDWALNLPGDAPDADLASAGPAASGSPHSMRETFRLPAVWFGIAIFILATGSEINSGQLTNSLLVDGRGIDPEAAGQWIGIYWACFTAGRALTGLVIDRLDHDRFLRVAMLGAIGGTALLAANLGPALSFLGLAVIGLTLAPNVPTLFSDTPRRVGAAHAANALGFQNVGIGLGLALPPWLAALLAERLGLEMIGLSLVGLAVGTYLLYELMLRHERHARAVSWQPATGPDPDIADRM